MHHLPHTGDLPTTVFTTAHSAVQFMPLNYYDRDISRETKQMVRINYGAGDGEVSKVKTFGAELPTCALDLSKSEPDLYGYIGDVVIRKFPYDPTEIFETDAIGK
jgi:primary-amine oxidase